MEVVDFSRFRFAIFAFEDDRHSSRLADDHILGTVLISESVTSDDNRIRPAGNETRDVFAQNRLTEDRSSENISDGSIGRQPHLFQLEFFHALLVWSDGGTFDSNIVLENSVGGVDCDLIVSLITS